MILHGSIVICIGIDVNSLSSAWLGKSTPLFCPLVGLITTRVWLGIYLRQVTSLTATKNSSINIYLDFDVFAFYIYLRTLHAHLHTTPADTVHTPHTDEWLVASKLFSIVFRMKKSSYSFILFLSFALLHSVKKMPLWLFFFFCFRALTVVYFLYF